MSLTSDIRRLDLGVIETARYVFNSLSAYNARRAAYRQTYDELNGLNKRELSELGISRSDITAIAREAARQA